MGKNEAIKQAMQKDEKWKNTQPNTRDRWPHFIVRTKTLFAVHNFVSNYSFVFVVIVDGNKHSMWIWTQA